MRFLFVVQGEGRGHLTQALALADILYRNGHHIPEVLVGNSPMRQIPSFFQEKICSTVKTFPSPNFLKTADQKHFRIFYSFVYNLQRKRRKAYFRSIRFISQRIDEVKPDVVVNFHEMLCGLAYRRYDIKTPMICVAHQYIFEHPAYIFPEKLTCTQRLLKLYSSLCCLRAYKRLALSFYPMEPYGNLQVIPPLLRPEIRNLQATTHPYITGYILNDGFSKEIISWHENHPDITVHVFWDKAGVPDTYIPHDRLFFHQLDDSLFPELLAGCFAFFVTAGFETVCEAIFLGKPLLLVPAHSEQQMNVWDALLTGSVVTAPSFDLSLLTDFITRYEKNDSFGKWVDQGEKIILEMLTS